MKTKHFSLSFIYREEDIKGLTRTSKKSIPIVCSLLVCLGMVSIFCDFPASQHQPSLRNLQGISPKCRFMFNIGVQKYPSRIGFEKRHFGGGVAPGTAYYEGLADTLPSGLLKLSNGSLDLLPKTKLELTSGALQYLECTVRMYTSEELKTCAGLRREGARGPLWMAFVGDSQMRNKFSRFLKLTENFNWYLYNVSAKKKTSISWSTFVSKNNINRKDSIIVAGDRDTRIDFIWATEGLTTHSHATLWRAPELQLEEWAHKASKVPDLVIVGFGLWTLLDEFNRKFESLKAVTLIGDAWLRTGKILQDLSTRTTVIAWCQARTKEFTAIDIATVNLVNKAKAVKLHAIYYYSRLHSYAGEWIDEVMHMALRNTGVIIWDSMVPPSLLNIRECQALHDAGMSNHPLYNNALHLCHDYIHTDGLTIQDELTMIMNLLCNEYVDRDEAYCCS